MHAAGGCCNQSMYNHGKALCRPKPAFRMNVTGDPKVPPNIRIYESEEDGENT